MTGAIVALRDHPLNRDPSASCVWDDRVTGDSIYRVTGGFVAVVRDVNAAFAEVFKTEADAREALDGAPIWSEIEEP